MVEKVFINYRREDARAEAARIRDRFAAAFGTTNVFMDVDNLRPGQRFDIELTKALETCDVFLAVIGARWYESLYNRAKGGGRDFVREEIGAALARGMLIVPVLLDGATLPSPETLPEDLRGLIFHQSYDVRHEYFGRDVEALIKTLREGANFDPPPDRLAQSRPQSRLLVVLAALVGLALLVGSVSLSGLGEWYDAFLGKPYTAYAGLLIDMKPEEVLYIKGNPHHVLEPVKDDEYKGFSRVIEYKDIEKGKTVRDYSTWGYDVGDKKTTLNVEFDKGAVISIQCTALGEGTVNRCPVIAGLADGSTEHEVIAKLGKPDVSSFGSGATKRMSYQTRGAFFILLKQRVYIIGIHSRRYKWGKEG